MSEPQSIVQLSMAPIRNAIEALEVLDQVSHYLKSVKIDDFLSALQIFKRNHQRDPKRPPMWLSSSIQPVDKP